MESCTARTLMVVVMLAAILGVCGAQQKQYVDKGAYDKPRLLQVVRLRALAPVEIAFMVVNRGVSFQVTSEVEREFLVAGAAPELIETAAVSFRPSNQSQIIDDQFDPKTYHPNDPNFGPPFSYPEILGLLESGILFRGFANLVRTNGINFDFPLDIEEMRHKILKAGASSEHFAVMRENIRKTSEIGTMNIYAEHQQHGFQSNPKLPVDGEISMTKYKHIKPGMTIVEAVRVMGRTPKRLGTITGSGYALVAYQWPEYGEEQIFILFRDGKLVFRTTRGLR